MHTRHWTQRVTVAGLTLAMAVPLSLPLRAGATSTCPGRHALGHRFTVVTPPTTPPDPAGDAGAGEGLGTGTALTDFAAPAGDPKTLLVTDGLSIFRSVDLGCTWTTAYTLGADLFDGGQGYAIATLLTARPTKGVAGSHVVYALLTPAGALALATFFESAPPALTLQSEDGGASWSLVAPAPSATTPDAPRCAGPPVGSVAPADPKVLYVECGGAAVDSILTGNRYDSLYGFYRSDDGGASWRQLPFPSSDLSVVADPGSAQSVYSFGSTFDAPHYRVTVWHSTDGGQTWTAHKVMQVTETNWIGGDVSKPRAGGPTYVLLYGPTGIYESTNLIRWRQIAGEFKDIAFQFAFYKPGSRLRFAVVNLGGACHPRLGFVRYPVHGKATKSVTSEASGRDVTSWGPLRPAGSGGLIGGIASLVQPASTGCGGTLAPLPQPLLLMRP